MPRLRRHFVPEGSQNALVDYIYTVSVVLTSHHPGLHKALFRIKKTKMMTGTTPILLLPRSARLVDNKEYGAVPKLNSLHQRTHRVERDSAVYE